MSAAPLLTSDGLSPEDEARLAQLVADIIADGEPGRALLDAVTALEPEQKPALIVALYEAVCYRAAVDDYWLQYRVWKAYHALGPAREDAAYSHAAETVRLKPDGTGSGQAFRGMFLFLSRRGRDRDALALFRYQMQHLPEHPAASPSELAPILRRLEPSSAELAAPAVAPRAEAATLQRVVEPGTTPPWTCPVFGGEMPFSLVPFARGMARPAITVAQFADAEALIYRNSIVVVDRFGDVHDAFSVRQFPEQVRAKFLRLEQEGQSFPLHEADDVVVISDEVSLPNICHVLLDHVTRLALYQRAGVDTGRALVIGSEVRIPAQREILRRAGVTNHVGTDRIARVRARRLWVSSNCRQLSHAAHFGADWAVAFVRQILGGQGVKGWRRLYLSRGDVSARQVTNEAEVIALLDAHGFEPIVPGRMSYDAQLAAFRQASHVVAAHGAGLTHILLCPPGAQVLEMFHPLYGTSAYAMQAAACGIHYAAMVARDWESDAPHWNNPALADVSTSKFLERHIRVDLETLSRYLATVV